MTIVRVGKTEKYATGWDSAFASKKGAKSAAAPAKSAKKAAPKKAAPKKAAKKGKK